MDSEKQPVHHEGGEKSEAPFLNKEWMDSVQDRAYKAAQPIISAHGGGRIAPETKYCHFVNKELKRILTSEGIAAEYQEDVDEHSKRGTILHAFTTANYEGENFLLDLQYKQFVPEEMRGKLPDYIVVSYNSEQDVREGLRKYHVEEDRIKHWTAALYPPPLSYTNLNASASNSHAWPKNPNPEDNRRR